MTAMTSDAGRGDLRLRKIISGGETGSDRGGLDAAMALGIEHGGWCPKGRRAEDGIIPERYRLEETPERGFAAMMRRNVEAADATIVLTGDKLTPGSRKTIQIAKAADRPVLHVRMAEAEKDREGACNRIRAWLEDHEVEVLNVAGSRESKSPGLQGLVADFLVRVMSPVGSRQAVYANARRIANDDAENPTRPDEIALATTYVATDVTIRVGDTWVPAARATEQLGSPLCVVTASNPGDLRPGEVANRRANEELRRDLLAHADTLWPALGRDPKGGHEEEGWAVFGVPRELCLEIGRKYGQVAIFEIDPRHQLVLECSGRWRVSREFERRESEERFANSANRDKFG